MVWSNARNHFDWIYFWMEIGDAFLWESISDPRVLVSMNLREIAEIEILYPNNSHCWIGSISMTTQYRIEIWNGGTFEDYQAIQDQIYAQMMGWC